MEKINFTVKDIKGANFGINDVVVKKVYPPLVDETVIPTKEQQVLTHEGEYGYDKVTVEPIPDEYIIPEGTLPITENTTYDVTRFKRVSANVKPAPELQDKEVTPTKEAQNVTFDSGFDGLNTVTIKPIPENYIEPTGTKEIKTEGIHDVTEYASVDVDVEPTLQDKQVTITENGTQNITADEGFDGLSNVEITTNAIENLTEELNEYDSTLTTQEVTIDDITKALRNKVLSSGGIKLNVFTQEDEPETKEGIWLQTSEKYDSVSLWERPTNLIVNERPQLQFDYANGAVARVGSMVYLFGGDVTSSAPNYAYKYNLADNTWGKMSNMPFKSNYNPAVTVGTDIYIGGAWNTQTFYKFDTLTETYTQLANAPAVMSGAYLVQVGDYIYQIGGEKLGTKMYKYSIINNKWTLLSVSSPQPLNGTSVFAIGTDIYLVSSRCYTSSTGYFPSPNNYVFDTTTETFRTLASITPNNFQVLASSINDNVAYLIGGDSSGGSIVYKYYPTTDSYVKCEHLPVGYASSPVIYGKEFLKFGGYNTKRELASASLPEDIIPSQNGKTIIVDTIENPLPTNFGFKLMNTPATLLDFDKYNTYYFADILYKLNENNIDVPVYYGDGTQWIKVKKPNNLLKLLEENASWVSYSGTEASAVFNIDNTITISADGTSSWGLNINQPNLTLKAGKTYKFSCNNIGSSTWISINNEQTMSLRSSVTSLEFTPAENIENPTIIIWAESSAVYDNVVWNIKLKEV